MLTKVLLAEVLLAEVLLTEVLLAEVVFWFWRQTSTIDILDLVVFLIDIL